MFLKKIIYSIGDLLAADDASHNPLDRPAAAGPATDGPVTEVRIFTGGESPESKR